MSPVPLIGYWVISWLLRPLLPVFLLWRQKIGREDKTRISERFGYSHRQRPHGQLIWIHAASVGEVNAVFPLIDRLLNAGLITGSDNNRPQNQPHILLTSGTTTSAEIIARRKANDRLHHHYIPIDHPVYTRRFIRHWQPDIGIFVESELWPHLLAAGRHAHIPLMLINARLSARSYRKWSYFPATIKTLLANFQLILAQDKQTLEHLQKLGAERISVSGNLKLDAAAPAFNMDALAEMQGELAGRSVWLAACTHEGEETVIADIHHALKKDCPDLLTLIVPRHPQRGNHLAKQLRQQNYQLAQRSRNETINATTDIYLADTLGETGLFYRLADIVFIGGSLIPHGGQNPIEAAQCQCAIITGPHIDNFQTIYHIFTAQNAIIKVPDASGLQAALHKLLHEPQQVAAMQKQAQDVCNTYGGAVAMTYQAICRILETESDKNNKGNKGNENNTDNKGNQDKQEKDKQEKDKQEKDKQEKDKPNENGQNKDGQNKNRQDDVADT